jgi:hypothetical protein
MCLHSSRMYDNLIMGMHTMSIRFWPPRLSHPFLRTPLIIDASSTRSSQIDALAPNPWRDTQ